MRRFKVGDKVKVSSPIFGAADPNLDKVGKVLHPRVGWEMLGWENRVNVAFDYAPEGVTFFDHELTPFLKVV